MANLSIDLTGLEQLQQMRQALEPKALDKAMRSALAYAAKAVPPAAGKAIASRYSIGSRRAQEDISRPYLTGLAEARISFSRRKPPTAMQYRVKATKTGVRYRLYKGADVEVPGGFFQTVRGRRMAVVSKPGSVYRQDLQTGRLKPRRGIDVIHGPSIGSIVLGKGRYSEPIQQEIGDRLLFQFGKGLERAMKARSRGFG
jgi:hypothetical protein